jgi:hypothetical protein
VTKSSPARIERRRRRGERGSIPIERNPARFEIAIWWALIEEGHGAFDAARRALLAVKGGTFTLEDIEGVLTKASAAIPLPQPFDSADPDKGLRRLAAKAKRAKPEKWLVESSALIRGLIRFIAAGKETGIKVSFDGLIRLGWGEVLRGLVDRIEAALKSNLPPAELEALTPAVRRMLADLRRRPKK